MTAFGNNFIHANPFHGPQESLPLFVFAQAGNAFKVNVDRALFTTDQRTVLIAEDVLEEGYFHVYEPAVRARRFSGARPGQCADPADGAAARGAAPKDAVALRMIVLRTAGWRFAVPPRP